ncbi:hypothetical protein NT6N_27360 [Oceaniferula spumae]|uniref:Uncharacterized protein n=1 Tax=Oceaniferula spumae TaxID=2979115 RepID=A0AAT9FP63_9BACT
MGLLASRKVKTQKKPPSTELGDSLKFSGESLLAPTENQSESPQAEQGDR